MANLPADHLSMRVMRHRGMRGMPCESDSAQPNQIHEFRIVAALRDTRESDSENESGSCLLLQGLQELDELAAVVALLAAEP